MIPLGLVHIIRLFALGFLNISYSLEGFFINRLETYLKRNINDSVSHLSIKESMIFFALKVLKRSKDFHRFFDFPRIIRFLIKNCATGENALTSDILFISSNIFHFAVVFREKSFSLLCSYISQTGKLNLHFNA